MNVLQLARSQFCGTRVAVDYDGDLFAGKPVFQTAKKFANCYLRMNSKNTKMFRPRNKHWGFEKGGLWHVPNSSWVASLCA